MKQGCVKDKQKYATTSKRVMTVSKEYKTFEKYFENYIYEALFCNVLNWFLRKY